MSFLAILFHFIGDYILQSHWMATQKTKNSFAAFAHAATYTLLFVLLAQSVAAVLVIFATHFLIDRFRLARYVCYAKNFLAPPSVIWEEKHISEMYPGFRDTFSDQYKWANCQATGYPSDVPPWLAVWLLIIVDNILHVCINAAALYFL